MTTAIDQETAHIATKFHLSLNVNDLGRSVAFLRALLGTDPAKLRPDYAKFELSDPPLVLSLEPHGFAGRGALNHVGFRMPDSAALVDAQRRLEAAGIETQREEGVECCYARQTKFWVTDPDGTLWEVYVFEGDIEHRGAGQALEVISPGGREFTPMDEPAASESEAAPPVTVIHRLGQPFTERLCNSGGQVCADGSVDHVLLQGTFNARIDSVERKRILREVKRVLRPDGEVLVHVLTSLRALPDDVRLQLPGPAAVVEQAPTDHDLLEELEELGFTGIRYAKFGAAPCFVYQGAEMRETKLLAYKPADAVTSATHMAMYKGPFRELRDDSGRVFRRGERSAIDEATWNLLKNGPVAEQFLLLATAGSRNDSD